MNFIDLQNECWGYLGALDALGQHNMRRRIIRDKINVSYDQIANSCPNVLCLTQQATLQLVVNQGIYYLDDWALRPLSAYTTDVAARKIRFHRAEYADRAGLRNPNLTSSAFGPWDIGWSPRNISAVLSGTGATATEQATTVTLAGSPAVTSAHIGRMFRFNGEDGDYKITAVSGSVLTLDRPVKARPPMDDNTTYTGGYTSVRWEIGPPQRVQIQVFPPPSVASVMSYRYALHPRILLNDDDTPEIPREFHHLIWKGALKELTMWQEDIQNYGVFAAEFAAAIEAFKAQDADDIDGQDTPHYESLGNHNLLGLPVDTYLRGQSQY